MTASVAASPHAFVAIEADASALARLEALGGVTRDGIAIEPSTVVAVAVSVHSASSSCSTPRSPRRGCSSTAASTSGIVLGLDDGMLVPVIHAASGLTLRALARRVADLARRDVTRQLSTDDLIGATVTIAGGADRARRARASRS